MLDMGFIPDIRRVLSKLPSARQTLFFSATLAPEMEELANTMVVDPVRVTIAPEKPTVDGVDQRIFFVGKRNKDSLLLSLLEDSDIEKVLVFIQMKHAANRLVRKLDSAGIEGVAIHGNKSQSARTKALDGFRRGHYRVLVATDVAARGLDVDGITHVINYDLPIEAETYVHRIGRTARAGATGDALSFCSAEDRSYLREIERLLNKEVPIDLDHEFHCEQARHSTEPPPKRGGGGGGKRGGGPAGESQKRRNRSGRGGQQFSKARRGSRERARSHAGR
jgi:ATP-dependent RNA helicase RhlE